ncbi:MAG: hypothetical protein K8R21_13025 [Leptospira sp.]|nr:hypothetical protein [Leptospira sp.]
MIKYASIFIPATLILSNIFIFQRTYLKINSYRTEPPFFQTDFTRSGRIGDNSKLRSLFDNDVSTFWIKEQDATGFDFEAELRLTHFYDQDGFHPKHWENLRITACENETLKFVRPASMQLELFSREAINVDKELRLPEEKIIGSYTINFETDSVKRISIKKELKIEESDSFPKKMYIIGIRAKLPAPAGNAGKPCLSDIRLE